MFSTTKPTDLDVNFPDTINTPIIQYIRANYDKKDFLNHYFSLDEHVEKILQTKFNRIALQFPEDLLFLSTSVFLELKLKLQSSNNSENYQICIIGDTAYSECCIDDISAQHYNVQYLIHFGRSCLSEYNGTIQIAYSFGKYPSQINEYSEEIKKELQQISEQNTDNPIILLYDIYHYHEREMIETLLQHIPNSHIAHILVPFGINQDSHENFFNFYGRLLLAEHDKEHPNFKTPIIIWIGDSQLKAVTNFMLYFSTSQFYFWDQVEKKLVQERLVVNKQLMRRYTMIEKTKDAEIIGIVAGTMSVSKYADVLRKMQRIIKNSGKQYYTYVVGKLNPHKLANFPEVDIFVLIACPESVEFDSRDFYKPIVTPLELEIALHEKTWNNNYRVDFAKILDIESTCDIVAPEVRYSLNTHSIHTSSSHTIDSSQSLVEANTMNVLSPSAQFFLDNKSWRGLDIQNIGQTAVEKVQNGLSGIPMQYDSTTF